MLACPEKTVPHCFTGLRLSDTCGDSAGSVCCGKEQSSISAEGMEAVTAAAVKLAGFPAEAPAAPIPRAAVTEKLSLASAHRNAERESLQRPLVQGRRGLPLFTMTPAE